MNYDYELELEVRDYECDIQGIVNNAVYQNYLEHCRHKFLQHIDLDFAKLHEDGIDGVVIKSELEYKYSLRPGDYFIVKMKICRDGGLKFVFNQDIYRKSDDKLIVKGKITTVLTRNGRPIKPDIVHEKLAEKGMEMG